MQISLPKGARRLIYLGITNPTISRSLTHITTLWIKESGPEWTVGRLKAIREVAYQLKAGQRELARELLQVNSISYRRNDLIPRGPWGHIVRQFVSAKKPSVVRKYDALLRLYTCLRLQRLSHKQNTKAYKSINLPYSGDTDFLERFSRILYHESRKLLPHVKDPRGPDGKIVVDLSKLSPTSGTHVGPLRGTNPLTKKSWGKHVASIWTSVYLPDSLKAVNPAEKLRGLLEQSGADTSVAGHLSVIQEGGCKGRVVAVPNAWEQIHFRPLHLCLQRLATIFNESCVEDQNKGAFFIKHALESGERVFSIDLSSATDRFPLKLQLAVLKGLGLGYYAEALEEISKAPWISPTGELWSYSVGQPMGLYGSFALFHLTHILTLRCLRREFEGEFRVLGDDVVITGRPLAEAYIRTLQFLGVTMSPGKTFASTSFGEFAGFVAYTTNRGTSVHRPFKWSGRNGFGSPISLLNCFGKEVQRLGSYWKEQFEIFTQTRSWRNPDLSPLISNQEDDHWCPVVNLNSHLLGSLGNRLNYSLDYVPVTELLDCYEEQQIILLGQKEKVRDGFSSAEDNLEFTTGVDNSEVRNLNRNNSGYSPASMLSTDPLMNSFKHEAKSGDGETPPNNPKLGRLSTF